MISKFTETNVKKPARGGMNIKSSIANELWYVIKSFFFSSRRRHTSWNCDWSSDVCSSDLLGAAGRHGARRRAAGRAAGARPAQCRRPLRGAGRGRPGAAAGAHVLGGAPRPLGRARGAPPGPRSEERRVGKSVELGGRRIVK